MSRELSLPSSSNFAQQGSVDWVQLANSTIQASLSVLSRFAAVDVHAPTLAVAHAIAGTFHLSVKGRDNVDYALSHLTSCTAVGNALYLGFGLEHPIRILAKTENGYACLALFGALSELSSSLDAAEAILVELMDILDAPRGHQGIRPSIRQWRAMLQSCSGAFAATTFPCVTGHFIRLFSEDQEKSDPEPKVGDFRSIASLLNALSKLSRGELHSITILADNIASAWMTAFGNYFLGLNVELYGIKGDLLHRSIADGGHIHIRMYRHAPGTVSPLVHEQTYIIPNARDIFDHRVGMMTGRVDWDEFICDSFGMQGRRLLKQSHFLGKMFTSTARLFEAVATADPDLMEVPSLISKLGYNYEDSEKLIHKWAGYHEDSRGRGFLRFTAKLFPELQFLQELYEDVEEMSVKEAIENFLNVLNMLENGCKCPYCDPKNKRLEKIICLRGVALVMLKITWTLSLTEFDPNIRVCRSGVKRVYDALFYSDRASSGDSLAVLCKKGLDLKDLYKHSEILFTGVESLDVTEAEEDVNRVVAKHKSGICTVLEIVINPYSSPASTKWLRIIPGSIISPSNMSYEQVYDMNQASERCSNLKITKIESLERLPIPDVETTTANLVVRETSNNLWIAFQFMTTQFKKPAVGPAKLVYALVESIGQVFCPHSDTCLEQRPLHSVYAIDGFGDEEPGGSQMCPNGSVLIRRVTQDHWSPLLAMLIHLPFNAACILKSEECFNCCVKQAQTRSFSTLIIA